MFQRITITPLERVPKNHGQDGIPSVWYDDTHPLPEGQKWVPIEEVPTPGENQKLEIELTTEKDGWRIVDLTPEEIAERDRPEPVTKFDIMQRLLALGKWDGFKAILAAAPEVVQDAWELTRELSPDHPIFLDNKETFKAGLGLTEEQFQQILAPSDL